MIQIIPPNAEFPYKNEANLSDKYIKVTIIHIASWELTYPPFSWALFESMIFPTSPFGGIFVLGTWVASHIQHHLPGWNFQGIPDPPEHLTFSSLHWVNLPEKRPQNVEKCWKKLRKSWKNVGKNTTLANDTKKRMTSTCFELSKMACHYRLVEKELSATILKQRLQCKDSNPFEEENIAAWKCPRFSIENTNVVWFGYCMHVNTTLYILGYVSSNGEFSPPAMLNY